MEKNENNYLVLNYANELHHISFIERHVKAPRKTELIANRKSINSISTLSLPASKNLLHFLKMKIFTADH